MHRKQELIEELTFQVDEFLDLEMEPVSVFSILDYESRLEAIMLKTWCVARTIINNVRLELTGELSALPTYDKRLPYAVFMPMHGSVEAFSESFVPALAKQRLHKAWSELSGSPELSYLNVGLGSLLEGFTVYLTDRILDSHCGWLEDKVAAQALRDDFPHVTSEDKRDDGHPVFDTVFPSLDENGFYFCKRMAGEVGEDALVDLMKNPFYPVEGVWSHLRKGIPRVSLWDVLNPKRFISKNYDSDDISHHDDFYCVYTGRPAPK